MRSETNGASSTKPLHMKAQFTSLDLLKKPIEIYVFTDPFCPESWSLDPLIKKLTLEYGRFFTMRPILCGQIAPLCHNKDEIDKKNIEQKEVLKHTNRTGLCCNGDHWLENPISFPVIVSIAIKAAELQGIKAGLRYLRKIQEHTLFSVTDISKEENLLKCAKEAFLDINEFKNDLHSTSARKALQCDVKLAKEMEVERTPSVVFFNESVEDEGLKLTGQYSYDIYVKVLKQMLQREVRPTNKPKLEEFITYFNFIGSKEVALIYDWPVEKACKEMKKLQLKQIVRCVRIKSNVYWKYIDR